MDRPEFYLKSKDPNRPESFSFPAFTAELEPEHGKLTLVEFAKRLAEQYKNAGTRDSKRTVIGVRLISCDFQLIFE